MKRRTGTVIEDKAKGGALGAGSGVGVVGTFATWVVAQAWWGGDVSAVPVEVTVFIAWLTATLGGFIGAYVMRHTPRPDVAPVEAEPIPSAATLLPGPGED
jgi:hypothetical protein